LAGEVDATSLTPGALPLDPGMRRACQPPPCAHRHEATSVRSAWRAEVPPGRRSAHRGWTVRDAVPFTPVAFPFLAVSTPRWRRRVDGKSIPSGGPSLRPTGLTGWPAALRAVRRPAPAAGKTVRLPAGCNLPRGEAGSLERRRPRSYHAPAAGDIAPVD